jgi:hypothetical protein
VKQQNEIELAVEIERTQEGLQDPSMQERRISTLELIRKEVLPLNPSRAHQQCKTTMIREDKNKNENKKPDT